MKSTGTACRGWPRAGGNRVALRGRRRRALHRTAQPVRRAGLGGLRDGSEEVVRRPAFGLRDPSRCQGPFFKTGGGPPTHPHPGGPWGGGWDPLTFPQKWPNIAKNAKNITLFGAEKYIPPWKIPRGTPPGGSRLNKTPGRCAGGGGVTSMLRLQTLLPESQVKFQVGVGISTT